MNSENEMIEVGTVIKQKGKTVTVRFPRKSSCEHCGMCAFKPGDAHVDMTLEDTLKCVEGDMVEVNVKGGTVLKLSLVVYVFPLLVGLAGFLIAYFTGLVEWLQFVLFFAAMTVGFLLLKLFDRRYSLSKKGKPYLVRKIVAEKEENDERS